MANGRDAKGRFVKGHKFSVGNNGGRPRRSVEEEFLKRLAENVTQDDFDKMILSAVSRAKAGDVACLRLLLQYLIGMPTQYVKQDIAGQLTHIIVNWDDHDGDNDDSD